MAETTRQEALGAALLDVVIIGLGKVGSRNADKPGLEALSHVGAVFAAGGFRIVAAIDPDGAAREAAKSLWAGRGVGEIAGDLGNSTVKRADLVVVAGPSSSRAEQIEAALSLGPRLLLVEKPLALTAESGRELLDRAGARGAEVRINFNRRFDPGHVAIKAMLQGAPRKIVMRYGKGLRNYASHMVDLLLDWFGPVVQVQALGDASQDDGPLDFRCRMKAGFDALIVGIDGLAYDQFETDIYYADRRIELADAGTAKRLYRPVEGRVYPGYAHLTDAPEVLHRGPVGGFVETYRAIAARLVTGASLGGCGPADALAGLAVVDAALSSAAKGGTAVRPVAYAIA